MKTDEEFEQAGLDIYMLNQEKKAASERDLEDKKAARAEYDRIMSMEREAISELDKTIRDLKSQMSQYYGDQMSSRRQRAVESRLAAVQKVREAGLHALADAAESAPLIVELPESEHVRISKAFEFEVSDLEGVSTEFLTIDRKKVAELVRRNGKLAEDMVGGIEVREVIRIAARGAK